MIDQHLGPFLNCIIYFAARSAIPAFEGCPQSQGRGPLPYLLEIVVRGLSSQN
jgi:hypothetical protein